MVLPYDPGPLPQSPAPSAGESIEVQIAGLPPYKDLHFSIRNSRHRIFDRFMRLRQVAVKAMDGRARYEGPVGLDLEIHAANLDARRNVLDYESGVMDTLDGSHGATFTYLPIVYEDDNQVVCLRCRIVSASEPSYRLRVDFLPEAYMEG